MAIQVLIGATVLVHFAVLVFLLLGGFLAWRWGWVIIPHVLMAGWAALIVTAPVTCPLTALENFLRARAGESPLEGGFIDTYVTGVLYPTQDVALVRWLVALVVIISWVGAFVRWLHASGEVRHPRWLPCAYSLKVRHHDRGTGSHRVGFGG
ncbi:hypothetical protein GTS_48820 [Gandjariella thermophila]|uniref:DUF2784 domain-containing protein n=2 Tax=Gandjariella thermophila TaxID=1931992 RepID=A0A4D4JFZ7_9PSEU|nr:hypothetical protein GTS_48820 [Gandjariella thermophila]